MIFVTPLALLGLAAVPLASWLMRLAPPPPRRIPFPPTALLRGLTDTPATPHRMPLWLLLLRLVALTLLIIGFAGPELNPPPALSGTGPILLVIDNGWASAALWPDMQQTAETIAASATTQNRLIALLTTASMSSTSPPAAPRLTDAKTAAEILAALHPQPWPTETETLLPILSSAPEPDRIYIADGISHAANQAEFLAALKPSATYVPSTPPPLLSAPDLDATGRITLHAAANPTKAPLLAETGAGNILATAKFDDQSNARITLPAPLAAHIARFTLGGRPTAGGTILIDSSLSPVTIGLAAGSTNAETPYLGTLYYLRRALPSASPTLTGNVSDLLSQHPNLVILADVPLSPAERDVASNFITSGGIIIRFAGPLTAEQPDPLSATPLLPGDRRLGGALTWSAPEHLAPFPANSPFAGLTPDPATTITQSTVADPTTLDPTTIWATLHDGTPLILGRQLGRGYIINILTSANAAWSNLALSGQFPDLLSHLTALAAGHAARPATPMPLASALDAFGTLQPPTFPARLSPSHLTTTQISAATPPGLYGSGDDLLAFNIGGHVPPPTLLPWPNAHRLAATRTPTQLGPNLIAAALLLATCDMLLTLLIRRTIRVWPGAALLTLLLLPTPSHAQSAALQTELGYVTTGDAAADAITADGLAALSASVSLHTSVQLAAPASLTPGQDDLSFYPLIYWALSPNETPLTAAGCEALQTYMSKGGLLIIDTPGGDSTGTGSGAGFATGVNATFARDTACLTLPPLEPLAPGNVIAHSFYIIQNFPGRFTGAPVLIATAPARDADGVTPIIVAQNDFVGAWARDATGAPEFSPLPDGESQRLIADRFGINLVIYALTGSYKDSSNSATLLLNQLTQ
jgi:hypothetical protein